MIDIRELNDHELDLAAGGTSIEEATALMNKWNAAITQAGLNATKAGNGGSCPAQYQKNPL